MPSADPIVYLVAAVLAACGLAVLVLGIRMFRDGKRSDALPQSVAGAALTLAASALPFARPDTSAASPPIDAGGVIFGGALLLFFAANAAMSLRLILLERRRDGVLFLASGLAAGLLGLLLLL